ncbi:MAG TPA: PAS domain-containing sensor histidine kinase, partial [Microbacterium sp.]|nr:PAS domain-containing sensor histidine kinase [Microbacterium sp.]
MTRTATPLRRRALARIDSQGRVAVGSQLLLCALTVVLLIGGIAGGLLAQPGLFALGTLGVALGTIATLAVPWARVGAEWAAVVPIIDILAIGALRWSDPSGGLGLLWALPAMWLASLGRAGLIASCTLIPALYWLIVALGPTSTFGFASLL